MSSSDGLPIPNDAIKKSIKSEFKRFVADVNPDNTFSDHLIQTGVISCQTWLNIKATCSTPRERCKQLMSELLESSNPTAFIEVREALMEDYKWIVEKIDSEIQQELSRMFHVEHCSITKLLNSMQQPNKFVTF